MKTRAGVLCGVLSVVLVATLAAAQAEQTFSPPVELAAKTLEGRAPRWRCQPERRFDCSPTGCEERAPTVWVSLDFRARLYERCDAKGCDRHPMRATSGGVMTSVTSPAGGAFFFRALNDGSQYAETVFLFVNVLNSFGRCVPIR